MAWLNIKKTLSYISNWINGGEWPDPANEYIKIENPEGKNVGWLVKNTTTGRTSKFSVGSGGYNRGIWDDGGNAGGLGNWAFCITENNQIRVNGSNGPRLENYTSWSSGIVTASANATITTQLFAKYGKVGQVYIIWKNKNAINVPANGNISNVLVGNLGSAFRPAIQAGAWSNGDNSGAAWYYITTAGDIYLGAMEATGSARTVSANSTFTLYATFICANA